LKKLSFNFSKDADIGTIAKQISEFFEQCPAENPADARLAIREGVNEIAHNGWNTGQNPSPDEVAGHIANHVIRYTSGKDDHFVATAEVSFRPRR
jgi:hypothetical protein